MGKNRFYLYTEYINYLDGMTDADQALLFRTILKYENGMEIEELTPAVNAVFSFIKKRLDNNRQEYEKTCEARREAGKVGAEAKQSKCKQMQANASKRKQTKADNDNDNDIDTDYVKENDKDTLTGNNTPPTPPPGKPTRETQEQIFDRLIEDQNVGVEMEKVLREWLKYKSERKETYKPTGMKNMISQVQNAVYQFGELAVMDRIKQAMANGWKGMNLDKMENNKASPQRRMDEVNDMISRWRVASEELERRRNDSG